MSVTKILPGGATVTRLAPGGTAVTRLLPGGTAVTRLLPGGASVTRLVPTPAFAEEEEGDAFLEECLGLDELYGLWTCSEVEVDDDLETGQVIMTDISENDRPDIKAILASTGNWQLLTGSGPGGESPSLTKYVTTDDADMGTTNFGALDSAITPIDAETDLSSGFVIYYMPSHWQDHEIVAYTGVDSSGAGSAKTLLLSTWGDYMHASRAEGATSPQVVAGSGSSGAGTGAGLCGQWMFWAWRHARHGSDEFKHYSYLQEIGSDWGTDQNAWNAQPQTSFASLQGGLRFGYGSSGTRPADCRWAAFAIFTDDIGEDAFEAIYDAAGFGS